MIHLYFHGGSGNHGCEAIVRSTLGILGQDAVLHTSNIASDRAYDLDKAVALEADVLRPLPKRSFRYLLFALHHKLTGSDYLYTRFAHDAFFSRICRGDICLSIGGDNYCYGGQDILAHYNEILQKKGAKTVLWGCSIDPQVLTPAVIRDLKRYDLITVREPLTLAAFKAAGITENVRAVADPAFLLQPLETPLPEGFLPGNTIGLNLSPLILEYTPHKDAALSAFEALIRHILDTCDSTVALIPHVVSDLEVLRPLYDRFRSTGRVILIPDQDCRRLKYIISRCRLFVGARTHATIAAYSSLVPTLAVGYSVKSLGIARDLFGTEEGYVLPIDHIGCDRDLLSAYDHLAANAEDITQQLRRVIPSCRQKAADGRRYLEALTEREVRP